MSKQRRLAASAKCFGGVCDAETLEILMTKRAVIVGIDDYTGMDASGNSNLSCCVSDAWAITEMLPTLGFDPSAILMLTDGGATREIVLASLGEMISSS